MKAIIAFGAAIASAIAVSACTAITLAEWAGYTDGSDGGSNGNGPDGYSGAQTACNSSYLSSFGTCGSCMTNSCQKYIASACTIPSGTSSLPWVDEYLLGCAQDTDVKNSNCAFFINAPDASFSTSTDPAALESNVKECLKENCTDACRSCTVSYSGSCGKNVNVGDDSPCGACVVKNCRVPLANCCDFHLDTAVLTSCTKTPPPTGCSGNPDCSGVFAVDAGDSLETTFFKCVSDNCGPGGSGECK